jgi:AcrR family transcriptional regulator
VAFLVKRLTRAEKTARSRERVLVAAGRHFRRKGFQRATVEQIADEAGFSTGVIYSQFGSKDELFLALMEQRLEWRTHQIFEAVRSAPQGAALREIWERARATQDADMPWSLLVIEFRVHAARNRKLNRRYAALHKRSLASAAELFEALASKAKLQLQHDPMDFARLVAALDIGGALERAVEGPSSLFHLSRHAVWLLLTEPSRGGAADEEDLL